MNILYFGNYDPLYSRNRVLLKGLEKNGVSVTEVNVATTRLSGLWEAYRLYKKHIVSHDFIVVGMSDTSALYVILARLLSKKPVVWDAFYSIYDSWVFDRKITSQYSLKALYYFLREWLACTLAHRVLLDTESHIEYFVHTFGVQKNKCTRVFVGTDDEIFTYNTEYVEHDTISIEFHGTYIPLQGIEYILGAAHILAGESRYHFTLIGNGQEFAYIQKKYRELGLDNVTFLDRVPYTDLALHLRKADIALGIFGVSDKAHRVIPNKVYEAMAVGTPVISARTSAIQELCTDRENIILCESGNSESLTQAIQELSLDIGLRVRIREAARKIYETQCTPEIIAKKLITSLHTYEHN